MKDVIEKLHLIRENGKYDKVAIEANSEGVQKLWVYNDDKYITMWWDDWFDATIVEIVEEVDFQFETGYSEERE